jgi:hypothetical protein
LLHPREQADEPLGALLLIRGHAERLMTDRLRISSASLVILPDRSALRFVTTSSKVAL